MINMKTIMEELDEIIKLTEELKKKIEQPQLIINKYPDSFVSEKEQEILSDQDLEHENN